MKQERQNICSMVSDAVLLLCKNGISFDRGIKIQGLLGVTVDDSEVFLIQICETLPADEKFNGYGPKPSCATGDEEVGNFYQSGTARDYGTRKGRKTNGYRKAVKFEVEAQCDNDNDDDVIVIKEEIDDEFQSETDWKSRTSASFDFSRSDSKTNCYKFLQNSSQNFEQNFADIGLDNGSNNEDDFGAFASEGLPVAGCPASVKEEYSYVTNDLEYSQNNADSNYLPKAWKNRRYGSRRDKTATKPKIEKYQPAKSIVSKYRQQQQQQQQMQQPSSSLIVVKSLHECGYPSCGKQFRHRRDLLRHQTHKHGRTPKKFLRYQRVWSRVESSYDEAEQFDPGLEYE